MKFDYVDLIFIGAIGFLVFVLGVLGGVIIGYDTSQDLTIALKLIPCETLQENGFIFKSYKSEAFYKDYCL